VGLQGLVVAGLSVALAVAGFRSSTSDLAGAEVLAVLGLLVAVSFGVLAKAIADRQRWARSPVLVLELICLPVAVTVVQGGRWYAGVPLAVSAVAVLVALGVAGLLSRPED
jgi:hypothetical protein